MPDERVISADAVDAAEPVPAPAGPAPEPEPEPESEPESGKTN